MNKIKKHLRENINIESKLELNTTKENLEFRKSNPFGNWNWKRSAMLVPIMIALVFTFGLTRGNNAVGVNALATVVTLDINPGILINLDENNEVISVEALNADAEALLLAIDVTITNLDELVANIIEVAEAQGYLLEEDTILFSIQSENEELNNEIESGLIETVNEEALKLGKQFEAVVSKYKEILDTNTSIISQAKATLIEALLITGDYTIEDVDVLSTMKVNDIKELLEEAYGIKIQDIVSDGNDDNPGQTIKRERYVTEILELELLTIEEIAILETDELKDVLKDYYEISNDEVKETASVELEELDREKYIETLSGLGILTPAELQALDTEDLEDLLEDYYDSIEDDEDAKEDAQEKAREAKEKAEEAKDNADEAKDNAEQLAEELYASITQLQEEHELEIQELLNNLAANRETMTDDEIVEDEEAITKLQEELAETIMEIQEEIVEKVTEAIEDAEKDADKAEKESFKIQYKARKEYYKELIKSISTAEEAEDLLNEVTITFSGLIEELKLKLDSTELSEDQRDDTEEALKDLEEDFMDFAKDIEDELEYLQKAADVTDETDETDEADETDETDETDEADEADETDTDNSSNATDNSGVSELNGKIVKLQNDMAELTTEYAADLEELEIKLDDVELTDVEISELEEDIQNLSDEFQEDLAKLQVEFDELTA